MATQGLTRLEYDLHGKKTLPPKTGSFFWFGVDEKIFCVSASTTALTVKNLADTTVLTISISALSLTVSAGVSAAVYKNRICFVTGGVQSDGKFIVYAITYNYSAGTWTAYKTLTTTATAPTNSTRVFYGVDVRVDWTDKLFACMGYVATYDRGALYNYDTDVAILYHDASGSGAGAVRTSLFLLHSFSSLALDSTGYHQTPVLAVDDSTYYLLVTGVAWVTVYSGSLTSGDPSAYDTQSVVASGYAVGSEWGWFAIPRNSYGHAYFAPDKDLDTRNYLESGDYQFCIGKDASADHYFVGKRYSTVYGSHMFIFEKRTAAGSWSTLSYTLTTDTESWTKANVITHSSDADLTRPIGCAGNSRVLFWLNPWKEP